MPLVGALNINLRLFRLARAWRRYDFDDDSGHGDTWLFPNSRSIQIQFRYFRGSGHARLPHFLRDAGTCCVDSFFLSFSHAPTVASKCKRRSLVSYNCELCGCFSVASRPNWQDQGLASPDTWFDVSVGVHRSLALTSSDRRIGSVACKFFGANVAVFHSCLVQHLEQTVHHGGRPSNVVDGRRRALHMPP